jgi:hypothetical protein
MTQFLALIVIGLGLVYLGVETAWLTVRLTAAPPLYNLKFFPISRRQAFIGFYACLIPLCLSPVIIKDLFFQMPKPSTLFDCDDDVTLMFQKLSRIGITSTPMLGKLSVTGEKIYESDHVWLLVNIGPWQIPFDWGSPAIGKQYYEGWALTQDELQGFVEQDLKQQESLPAKQNP